MQFLYHFGIKLKFLLTILVCIHFNYLQRTKNNFRFWVLVPTVGTVKWYFPSHIVLSKSAENFSKCNLLFFLGVKIKKMEAEVLFEVKGFARDLRMFQGLHFFNQDPHTEIE